MKFDFDEMRAFVAKAPTPRGSASLSVRKLRLKLFDLYRYMEDYEQLYKFVTLLGGKIE